MLPAMPSQPSKTLTPARRRYGLVGPNGSGKSTLLKALGNREVPVPEHIDIYFLDRCALLGPALSLSSALRLPHRAARASLLGPACHALLAPCSPEPWRSPHRKAVQ